MRLSVVLVIALALSNGFAARREFSREFQKAAARGAQAKECLHIVDQDGVPVPDAKVSLIVWRTRSPSDARCSSGMTDTQGIFVAEGVVGLEMRCVVEKDGYYMTKHKFKYGYSKKPDELKDGKWLPYGTTTTLTLKKIINPVVKGGSYMNREVPALDEWLGFDLQDRDWVAPFGKGRVCDVKIRMTWRKSGSNDFGAKMELRFDETPKSGAYFKTKDAFSEFQTVYKAEPAASYTSEFAFEIDRSEDKIRISNVFGEDRYFVYRVRTQLDDKGEIKSAHYGTIHGDWNFCPAQWMRIENVFFNEKENDLNLEDTQAAECVKLRIRDSKQVE